MTREQEIAIEHHCRFAFECAHPRFAFTWGFVSIVLTVNSGYE